GRTLGIADIAVSQLIAAWSMPRHVSRDAGVAEGPWGNSPFIEGIGAGVFTTAVPHIETNKTVAKLKDADAKLDYTLQLLREHLDRCAPTRIGVKLDGKDAYGDYILFETLLMDYIGPNLDLVPRSVHGEGMFNIVMISEEDRAALHEHLKTRHHGTLWPP